MDRRSEKRVCPPEDAVLAFALWSTQLQVPARQHLSMLGQPTVSSQNACDLIVTDISTIGIGLEVFCSSIRLQKLIDSPGCYVYMVFKDYQSCELDKKVSFFFHGRIVRATFGEDSLDLGISLLQQGLGSSFDKCIDLYDIHRYGASRLMAWIDSIVRNELLVEQHLPNGIDMDCLLDEISLIEQTPIED